MERFKSLKDSYAKRILDMALRPRAEAPGGYENYFNIFTIGWGHAGFKNWE